MLDLSYGSLKKIRKKNIGKVSMSLKYRECNVKNNHTQTSSSIQTRSHIHEMVAFVELYCFVTEEIYFCVMFISFV